MGERRAQGTAEVVGCETSEVDGAALGETVPALAQQPRPFRGGYVQGEVADDQVELPRSQVPQPVAQQRVRPAGDAVARDVPLRQRHHAGVHVAEGDLRLGEERREGNPDGPVATPQIQERVHAVQRLLRQCFQDQQRAAVEPAVTEDAGGRLERQAPPQHLCVDDGAGCVAFGAGSPHCGNSIGTQQHEIALSGRDACASKDRAQVPPEHRGPFGTERQHAEPPPDG